MAKSYLDIVKYMVVSKFNIDGLVDKPDIIGAVFGQTEGLLGDELDLRELQKNGKIGRIEIDVSQSGNKTYGKLLLPASLDRIETCILGAAVESVDRVGPFDAQFQVEKIEDTRSEKRRKILDRAKSLLKLMLNTQLPDSKELSELVQSDVKASEITSYGADKLPAGPDVATSNEVILVEGRADVVNLLKSDITNVVAVGGAAATIPKTLIDLINGKETTMFVDGDRGGDMIVRAINNAAEVDFVAKAPAGKEVEELTRKEIIKALRSKVPIEQYIGAERRNERNEQHMQQETRNFRASQQREAEHVEYSANTERHFQAPESGRERFNMKNELQQEEKKYGFSNVTQEQPQQPQQAQPKPYLATAGNAESAQPQQQRPIIESAVLAQLSTSLEELSGTLRSRLFSNNGDIIEEIPISKLLSEMQHTNGVYGIALDGVITQRLVELALQKGIRAIYGIRANQMLKKHPELVMYTKEQGKLE